MRVRVRLGRREMAIAKKTREEGEISAKFKKKGINGISARRRVASMEQNFKDKKIGGNLAISAEKTRR